MEVYVRDSKGGRFAVRCEPDDDISVLTHRYSAVSGETIDRNVFKYVLTFGGREVGESDLLSDLGVSHESTVVIGVQRRKIEFKTVDYQKLLDLPVYIGWGTQKPLVPTVPDRIKHPYGKVNFADVVQYARSLSFEKLVPIYFAIADDWVTALRDIYDDSAEINDFIARMHPSPEELRQEIYRLHRENVTDSEKKRLLELISGEKHKNRFSRGVADQFMIMGQGLLYPYDIVSKLMGKEVNDGWEIVQINNNHASNRPVVIFKRVI